jgi:putative heme-binding domain-containing protein
MLSRDALLLIAIFLACAGQARAADEVESPDAERASFKIADGFDVSLFASESDGVVKPIQIRFDARGRLFVIQSNAYPQVNADAPPDDKVLILDDADHDGKCDKVTVFARGLTIPTGIELGDGGVYVGTRSQLLFLKDTDGDDHADEKRVVLGGFGTGDMHQTINSFAWGPGGELWMSQGLSIRSRVETPWGIVSMSKAGLWRLNVHSLKLEPFFGSEQEPQNPWGFVWTRWGEPIVIAGNNSSHNYPVPALVPRWKDAAIPLIWKGGAGRKCSGGAIVETSAWPRSWQGALIVGGYINNAVWAMNVVDDGSGFALVDREPLITSSGKTFRPVDVKFGPDGALYVCDWSNPIIGHYQASFWDPRRDKTHGRIWRVTAKGHKLTTPPKLEVASLAELFEHLRSDDGWTRYFAKRVLADTPTEKIATELMSWAVQPDRSELDLKEAIGVYQSHDVVWPNLLEKLCAARDPGARAYAAGVVGACADRLRDPLAMLRPLVSDVNPRVRLRAVVACTYVTKPEAVEVAMTAAEHPTDAFLDYAINQAVYSLKPQWIEAFKAGRLTFDNKPARLAAFVKADGTPDTLVALRRLVSSATSDAGARENFLRILADTGDATDLVTIVNLPDSQVKARLLPAVAEAAELRNVKPAGDLAQVVTTLLASRDDEVRAGALRLAAAWKVSSLGGEVEKLATDTTQAEAVRRAAAEALPAVAGASSRETLLKLCADASHPAVRSAAIAAVTTIDLDAASVQAALFLSTPQPDASAESLVRAFVKRAYGPASLARALADKAPTADAAKIALRVMSATGQRDETLAPILEKAAGLTHEARNVSDSEIAALAKDARDHGDPSNGQKLFLRPEMSCNTCHAVAGRGGKIGPDLGNVGTAQTVEFIVGAVLMPNREVKEGYVAHEFLTKTGERYQGYITSEDAKELVIRDIAQDRQVRLRKDAIAKRAQRGSPMPPGLTDTLTKTEFRDLVAYLASLGHAQGQKSP